MCYLNELKPLTPRKSRNRRGRGIGSGLGKTGGRGHKGQKSRSGGYHKVGFEGGQMPLQRRVPKYGFTSRKGMVSEELRLEVLGQLDFDLITVASLKQAGVIRHNTRYVKIFSKGELNKAVKIQGIPVSSSAKAAILKAGGSVE
jgi:large subunit ribosomal protein L15